MILGIDPKKSNIFIQSHIPAHSELTWILNCLTPLSWLEGMIQFKEKSNQYPTGEGPSSNSSSNPSSSSSSNVSSNQSGVSVGLLDYPVLMASDILLYQTNYVPVGEDQRQHLELTRDICRRINERYKKRLFVEPQNLILSSSGSRIMSLTDGNSKMSKSSSNDYSRINLLDSAEIIQKKIKRCKTDSISYITYTKQEEEKEEEEDEIQERNDSQNQKKKKEKKIDRPECQNLVGIYRHMTGYNEERISKELEGLNWSQFKPLLSEAIIEHLKPIQLRYSEIIRDQSYVEKILQDGSENANEIAEDTLKKVKNAVGFYELKKR